MQAAVHRTDLQQNLRRNIRQDWDTLIDAINASYKGYIPLSNQIIKLSSKLSDLDIPVFVYFGQSEYLKNVLNFSLVKMTRRRQMRRRIHPFMVRY